MYVHRIEVRKIIGTQKMVSKALFKKKCPECGGENLVFDPDMGETVCGDCGLVVEDVDIDRSPEWRAFTKEERESRSRVGMPTFYSVHDKGLSTTMGNINRDAHGRKLPLKKRLQMWRLRKWQIRSRAHSSIDRNLAQAMTELDRLSDKLSIPNAVKEKAALIYRKALDKGLVRGRSTAGIAAASLYAACRRTRTPRILREVSEKALVSRREVSRDYRLIITELGLRMPVSKPSMYLTKVAERANLSGEVQLYALEVLQQARREHITAGKDPIGLAAAALYIGSIKAGDKITQKDIADAAGITEVTIRNRYKNLSKLMNLEFD
jgi:transcription initiation factor TFIIB